MNQKSYVGPLISGIFSGVVGLLASVFSATFGILGFIFSSSPESATITTNGVTLQGAESVEAAIKLGRVFSAAGWIALAIAFTTIAACIILIVMYLKKRSKG